MGLPTTLRPSEFLPRDLRIIDPATENLVGTLPQSSSSDIDQMLAEAVRAGNAWSERSPAERACVLRQALDEIERESEAISKMLTAENGKLLTAARAEVEGALGIARAVVGASLGIGTSAPQLGAGELGFQLREPRGVIACIVPWNFPIAIGVEAVFAALAAGNAVIWKPSELTPLSSVLARDAAVRALPEGMLQTAVGDGRVGQTLVEHKQVDAVVFVGSEATGRRIAARAGQHLKKCLLELGGKDALIIDADVDPGAAARFAADSAFANAGQICTSTERIYVHRAIAADFLAKLCLEAERLRVGPGNRPDVDLGPLIARRQQDHVNTQVRAAVDDGAKVLTGGAPLPGAGFFYPPTVLCDVPDSAEIMNEETFGPIAPVRIVDDFTQGLRLANNSRFGLGGIVLTNTAAHAHQTAKQLRAGMVKINTRRGKTFGGSFEPFGASGLGAGYGVALLRELTIEKSVQWKERLA
jgi:acyl-CoA reductase-like NAD-dependent aldehyde dehydrogenase